MMKLLKTLLTFPFLITVIGCSMPYNDNTFILNNEPTSETTVSEKDDLSSIKIASETKNDMTSVSESAPRSIIFRETSEYTAFVNSLELSDEEFDQFVRENNYNMNGIKTKEDAAELIEKMESMTVPAVENAEIVGITVAVETGYCTIRQKNDTDAVYHVRIDLNAEETISINTTNKVRINSDAANELYYFENQNDQHQYEGSIDGNYVYIWTNNVDKTAADDTISTVTFTTLSDLIE